MSLLKVGSKSGNLSSKSHQLQGRVVTKNTFSHDTRRTFIVYFHKCYGSQLFPDISFDLPTFLDRASQSEYKTTNSFSINKLIRLFF